MKLPKFINDNKDKIIEIAKWSNETNKESAIIQYLNNKTKILYSNESLFIAYPNRVIKNSLHIHPLSKKKMGYDRPETKQKILDYLLFNLFKVLQSDVDMTNAIRRNSVLQSLYEGNGKKNSSSDSYVVSLDNKNNILYIRNYSVSVVKNIDYNVLIENMTNTVLQFIEEFRTAYYAYHVFYEQGLNTKNIDEFHNVIINEMKNKETTKKIKEYLDNNFILYTIKL